MSPPSERVKPCKLIGKPPGLYNSIHSSLLEAAVPPQATSLMTTESGGTAVGEAVGVGVSVGVRVSVGVGVSVGVRVSVGVSVAVEVGVGKVIEFGCLGVPLIGLPTGRAASSPLR